MASLIMVFATLLSGAILGSVVGFLVGLAVGLLPFEFMMVGAASGAIGLFVLTSGPD